MTAERQLRLLVETQIAPLGVRSARVLRAMAAVDRAAFLPAQLQPLAYAEMPLQLTPSSSQARFVLSPGRLALMLEMLDPQPHESGLDIGCNCGYSSALLGHLCESVIGLEADEPLAAAAERNLEASENAAVVCAPLLGGHTPAAPYDFMFVNGLCGSPDGAAFAPLRTQMRAGARLVCGEMLGRTPQLALYRLDESKNLARIAQQDGRVPPLLGEAAAKQSFAQAHGFL